MKLKTLAGIVALSALAGCNVNLAPDSAAQYTQPQRPVEQAAETRRTIDATIVKTMPGTVSFSYDRGAGEHQFVFVGAREADGTEHTLIYPMTSRSRGGSRRGNSSIDLSGNLMRGMVAIRLSDRTSSSRRTASSSKTASREVNEV